MSFFSDFGKGVSTHVTAISFIAKHNLWTYFIFPVGLTVTLTIFGYYSINAIGNIFSGWIDHQLESAFLNIEEGWITKILSFFSWIFSSIVGFILKWIIYFLLFKIIRYFILIICSPIMTMLTRRVDEIQSGIKIPFHLGNFVHDIFRAILVVLRNLILEAFCMIGLFIVYCIPVFGWFALPFFFIFGWYFIGFNMMDYTYERRRMKISQGAHFTRKHMGIAIGNGMMYSFLLWIPFLGICLAPILSSVAATLATIEALEKK